MHHINIDMNIELTGSWHIGSGEGGFFTDRLIRLDASKRPYLPASTLRGVLREQCECLSEALGLPQPSDPHSEDSAGHRPYHQLKSPVDQLFGTKYCQSDLYFRDATMSYEPLFPTMTMSRNSISRALGTAKESHLFQTEYASSAFLGTSIRGWHKDMTMLEQDFLPLQYILLLLGIQNIERIGGDKSTGKGNCRITILELRYNQKVLSWDEVRSKIEDIFVLWEEYLAQEGL